MTTPADAGDGPQAAEGTSDAQTLQAPTVTRTPLLAEAAGKSDIMWLEIPGERAFPVWYAWVTDRFYVVSGEGEQILPPLPEVVHLVLRSKDTGGRLLTVSATAHRLEPHTPSWNQAVTALAAERLNATDDVAARWADSGLVHALHPFGEPLGAPGAHGEDSGRAAVLPAPPTTVGWRPWHAGRS